MKDKLIQKIREAIASVEDTSIILDYNDDSKQEIIENLIIPFMETFECDTIDELKEKLNILITKEEDEIFSDVINSLAESLLQDVNDDEINELFDNVENFVTNTFAILNKLSKEEDLETIKADVEMFIKELESVDNSEEETPENEEETNEQEENETENNEEETNNDETKEPKSESKDESKSDKEENKDENTDDNKDEATVKFTIVNPKDKVDETPWSEINKVELKNKLMDAYEAADEAGKKEIQKVIDEVFALVKSYDKMGDWKWPHHSIKGNDVLLNVNGLRAAALFLLKPNSSKNLTPEEKMTIAKHLMRHYNEIDEKAPERLMNIAENKESVIILNVKDNEYKEFSESFNINEEDVYVYVGLMEALLTDLVNSGIIAVDMEESNEESVMTVKLTKEQVEEMLKYFDVMTNDIVNILEGNVDKLSYKVAKDNINDESIKEIVSENEELKSKVSELTEQIDEYKNEIENREQEVAKQKLNNEKFAAIINFIKSIDDVDSTLIQFINNVIEAEDVKEVQYLYKIGTTFMKSTRTTPKFKKVSNLTGINADKIFNLLEDTEEKKESGLEKINKKVEALADYFD